MPQQRHPTDDPPETHASPVLLWLRAALFLSPLVVACFAVRSCGRETKPWHLPVTASADAAVAPAPEASVPETPADGAILTAADELLVLRRVAASLSLEDESRLLLVLEQRGAAPGRSDSGRASQLVSQLQTLLDDESPVVRCAAVALLGRMAEGDAPDAAILPALGDAEARVRAEAVRSLAFRGAKARVERLLTAAADADPRVRRAVAVAFGRVQSPESQDVLIRYLADPEGEVVRAAGDSLARTLKTLPHEVLAAASSERAIVRIAAARCIAAMRDNQALHVLRTLSEDKAWEVRREAIRGLGVLGEPHAAVAIHVLEDVARAADRPRTDRFEALQAMDRTPLAPDAAVLLTIAKEDADQVIRMLAARTLLARGDTRGLGVLVDLLSVEMGPRTDDEDRIFIRKTCAETLEAVAGTAPGDGSQAAWKSSLGEIEARLAASGLDYSPPRLVEFW